MAHSKEQNRAYYLANQDRILARNKACRRKQNADEALKIELMEQVAKLVPVEIAAKPTQAQPGSERKILRLSARYEHGLPLWNGGDA